MNYPLANPGQVRAAAGLAEVADRYGRVTVISRTAGSMAALLDHTAHELSQRHMRCVRVQAPASGGLALRGLIAQLTGRDPGALTDGDLKAGFIALTEPGQGYGRVALLVAEAHGLLPSAARYIQLACQSSPTKLCVVLAGQPGLAAVLAGDDLAPLRGAMHVMELPEPAGHGLFDPISAMPELRPMSAMSSRDGSSSLARLGLAALIIPIVGLIWWRHLPAAPMLAVPAQDARVQNASVQDAPALSNIALPAAEPPLAAPADRAGEPAPPAPDRTAPDRTAMPPAEAAAPAEPVPAPPDTTPEPSVPEAAARPDMPAETGVTESTEPPAAASPSSEPPPQRTDLAKPPAPAAPVPDAALPVPDPAAARLPPPPNGTLTVTGALAARGGARRAAPLAPIGSPARAVEDRPGPAEEHRCRDIVLKAQLGKDPSDADTQFLRNGCRGN